MCERIKNCPTKFRETDAPLTDVPAKMQIINTLQCHDKKSFEYVVASRIFQCIHPVQDLAHARVGGDFI